MTEGSIQLPTPRQTSSFALEQAIRQRRSQRKFGRQNLGWHEIGQLAWAAQGITGDDNRWRAAPSAGALHPLTLYVLLKDTAYRYDPRPHQLLYYRPAALAEVAAAALNQHFIAEAPCVFAFSGRPARVIQVYKTRGRLYLGMDLGHAAQNLLLQATALGLVGVPVGAFDEAALHRALSLPSDEEPLYLIPVGHPA